MSKHFACHANRDASAQQFGGAVVAHVVHMQVRAADGFRQLRPCGAEADWLASAAAFKWQGGRVALGGPDAAHQVGGFFGKEQHARLVGLGLHDRDGAGGKVDVLSRAIQHFGFAGAAVDQQADQHGKNGGRGKRGRL